jgi:hypothetical protein
MGLSSLCCRFAVSFIYSPAIIYLIHVIGGQLYSRLSPSAGRAKLAIHRNFPHNAREEECMDEASSIHMLAGGASKKAKGAAAGPVYLMRPELAQILNVYGRMVAAGDWRDYAIDHLPQQAIFSIFRRTSEMPLYRIIKEPALASQQGVWRIVGMDGQVLKRGKQLDQLLRYYDRQLLKAVD